MLNADVAANLNEREIFSWMYDAVKKVVEDLQVNQRW